MTLIAFHNSHDLKTEKLAQIAAHREADELIKGVGWENGKGCAIGCTLHNYDHDLYESELGIPVMLAHLEDAIFEELPNNDAKAWPEQFLNAIEPGSDLSLVGWKFLHWMLVELEKKDFRPSARPVILKAIDVIEPITRGLVGNHKTAKKNKKNRRTSGYYNGGNAGPYDCISGRFSDDYGWTIPVVPRCRYSRYSR